MEISGIAESSGRPFDLNIARIPKPNRLVGTVSVIRNNKVEISLERGFVVTALERVNAGDTRLNRVLRGYLHAEFWQPVDARYGDHPYDWPNDAHAALLLVFSKWRTEIGSIDIVARTYACVPYQDRHACVLQVIYARVKSQELPKDASPKEAGGSAGNSPSAASSVRQIQEGAA